MNAIVKTADRPSLLATMAARYHVEPEKMLTTLKATCFKGQVSNEQMMALLIVANEFSLNPFTKEIYAFPDKGGIVPVVGVDGWSRIMNDHVQFDGVQFEFGPDDTAGLPTWCECVIYRKDRAQPIRVREFMAEVKRGTAPWQSHPRRMLRHKTMVQAARIAFGFGGIYDQDEAERIVESTSNVVHEVTPAKSRVEQAKRALRKAPEPAPVIETVDVSTGELLEAAPAAASDDYLPEFSQGNEVNE